MNAISNFGERVKACRNELGITQAELAELAGVKRNTVYMWESGTSKPWPKTVDKLAELFVVFPDWLSFGTGPKNKTEKEKLAEEARVMRHQREKEALEAKRAAEAAEAAQSKPSPRCSYVKPEPSRDEKILGILNRSIQSVGKTKRPDARKVHKLLATMRSETEELIFFGPETEAEPRNDSEVVADINQLISVLGSLELQTTQKEDLYLYLNEKRSDHEMKLLFR